MRKPFLFSITIQIVIRQITQNQTNLTQTSPGVHAGINPINTAAVFAILRRKRLLARKALLLAQHGIDCAGKTARRLTRADGVEYDLLIGMDAANIRDMKRICGAEAVDKIHFMLDYAGRPGASVSDPWYTRDFDKAWSDIEAGCRGLIETLEKELRH